MANYLNYKFLLALLPRNSCMEGFQFTTTKSICCKPGAVKELHEHCQSLGIKKPMVITDQGIINCGIFESINRSLLNTYLQFPTFSQVVADPPESIILDALRQAIEEQVDGIIGLGGGSSLDTAKLVALLAKSNQSLQEVYGVDQAIGDRLPLILIPTTAGTGSEVTPIAIVTTGESTKAGIVCKQLLPDIAILDAELTLNLPAHVTAATGIDAMVHAIEAYTSKIRKNSYSDMLAKQALTLLSNNIVTATFDGKNIVARQNMLLGACLAGQAFANAPVAAVHALAYPLGGHFHIPHGLSNSLVLPHVMDFNSSHCANLYAELAPFILTTINIQDSPEEITVSVIDYLDSLIKKLHLPTRLRDLDIQQSDITTLADDAMLQTRLLVNNPKTVTHADALAIYQAAY
jgi:alcohol dehydrogenase class IV